MGTKQKPFRVPVNPDLAKEILNIPLGDDVELVAPRTIGERLAFAQAAVKQANEHLATSHSVRIIAEHLMRERKKRGSATLEVMPNGEVHLVVRYDVPARKPVAALTSDQFKSKLPTMPELRTRAETLGVDILDLGRQKIKIIKRLEASRGRDNGKPKGAVPVASPPLGRPPAVELDR